MYPDLETASIALLSCVLFLASCSEVPSEAKVEQPVAETSEQIDDHAVRSSTVPPEPPNGETAKQDSAVAEHAHKKPLDLSMPAETLIEFGAVENEAFEEPNLLPELFDQQQKPDNSPVHMRGRVYLPETQQENRYPVDGGELTIEIETR